MLCIVMLLICPGCLPFEANYASAMREHPKPGDPLAGAWQGEWHSDITGERHPVRAIIRRTNSSGYDVWIEMSGFGNIVAAWIEAPDLKLQPSPDGTGCFQTKLPLVAHNIRAQSVWAEAVEFRGNLHGPWLQMTYRTNDALRELDHGRVELHRITGA